MTTKGGTRLPLGGDLYLTRNQYRGETKIHIRKFETRPCKYNENNTFIAPTKYGITLTLTQLYALNEALLPIMPHVLANNLTALPPQVAKDVGRMPLGGSLYLTTCCWDGELKVHIRNFVPLSLINKFAENPDTLQPTKTGVVLTRHQTIELYKHLDGNRFLFMPPLEIATPSHTRGVIEVHTEPLVDNKDPDNFITQKRSSMADISNYGWENEFA